VGQRGRRRCPFLGVHDPETQTKSKNRVVLIAARELAFSRRATVTNRAFFTCASLDATFRLKLVGLADFRCSKGPFEWQE
jgi:hypothetical protein